MHNDSFDLDNISDPEIIAAFTDNIESDGSLPELDSPLPEFSTVHLPAATTSNLDRTAAADFDCPLSPKALYLSAPPRIPAWKAKNIYCNQYSKRITPLKRLAPHSDGKHEFIGTFVVAFDGCQPSLGRIDTVHVHRDDITYDILFLQKCGEPRAIFFKYPSGGIYSNYHSTIEHSSLFAPLDAPIKMPYGKYLLTPRAHGIFFYFFEIFEFDY